MTKETRNALLAAAVRQLEAAVDTIRVALAEDLGDSTPPLQVGCPHPTEERRDMTTMGGGPVRAMCRLCGVELVAGAAEKGAA